MKSSFYSYKKNKNQKTLLAVIGISLVVIGTAYFVMPKDPAYFDVQSHNYIQSGNFFNELSFSASGYTDYSLGSCREYTKLSGHYGGSWHEIGAATDIQFNPVFQQLVTTSTKEVIDSYKRDLYLNCDYLNGLDSVYVSGTYHSSIYNSNPGSFTQYKYITNVGGSTIASKRILDGTNMLIDSVVFSPSSFENQLTLNPKDNTVGFSVVTDTSLVFKVKSGTTEWTSIQKKTLDSSTWSYYRALSVVTNSPAPTPTQSSSRNQPMEITNVYQTIYPDKPFTTLDTTLSKGRQLTIEVKMTKWLASEGTPIIEIKKPNGITFIKLNTGVLRQSGEDMYAFNRISLDQNSDQGTWTIIATNVNRATTATKTFQVTNSAPVSMPTLGSTSQGKIIVDANGCAYREPTAGTTGVQKICKDAIEITKPYGLCYGKTTSECVVILENERNKDVPPGTTTIPTETPPENMPSDTPAYLLGGAFLYTINFNGDQEKWNLNDLKGTPLKFDLQSFIRLKDPQQKEFVEMIVEPVIDFRTFDKRVDQIQNAKITHTLNLEVNGQKAGTLALNGVAVGQFTSDRAFWKISRINVQANQLQSDLQKSELSLKTGDTLRLVIDLTGKFDLIADGKRYNTIVDGMQYSYELTYAEKEDLTCPEGQVRERSICVDDKLGGGSGGSCLGLTPEECAAKGKSVPGNNKCQSSDPSVPCEAGEEFKSDDVTTIITGLVNALGGNSNSNSNNGFGGSGGPSTNGGIVGFCDPALGNAALCSAALAGLKGDQSNSDILFMMMIMFVFVIIIVVVVVLAKSGGNR